MRLNVNKRYLILLAGVFLISLLLRLWLLDKRWINPDEGAHMMDAVLVLDGKIPKIDFDSRQPLYTYAIAVFLKTFGIHYTSGRLLTILCSMLSGILVFLLARRLFDEKVAVLSSSIYWMLPLELYNSSITKTQPLTILLTCISFYFIIKFYESRKKLWLILSGLFAAMGYYVRESALIIPVTVLGFFILMHKGRLREIIKGFGIFLTGYISFLLIVFLYYNQFMNLNDIFMFTPFNFLIKKIGPFLNIHAIDTVTSNISSNRWTLYYDYIFNAVLLHSFLFVGLAFSIITFSRDIFARNQGGIFKNYVFSYLILYLWILFLFIGYAYYFLDRGFFIDYFREFLPPLVIIFAAWIRYSFPALERDGVLERFILYGLLISGVLFFTQTMYKEFFRVGPHASLSIALFTLFGFIRAFKSKIRKFILTFTILIIIVIILLSYKVSTFHFLAKTMPSLIIIGIIYSVTLMILWRGSQPFFKRYAKFVGYSIMFSSFIVSLTVAAIRMDVRYDSVWSPESVKKTAAYLKTHTGVGDEVLSGAVIWELEANRRPFQMISHPLKFIVSIPDKEKRAIINGLRTSPPKVIILDGYTEKSYIRQIPWVMDLLKERYELKATMGPARYQVEIYQLKEDSNKMSASFNSYLL